MLFHEKLDFMMKILNTSNSSLGRYTALDPSYISLLRRGKRQLPKAASFLESMAVFFAKHCTEEYQQTTILKAIGIQTDTLLPAEELKNHILQFLTQNDKAKSEDSVHNLVSDFSNRRAANTSRLVQNDAHSYVAFYGVEGKRQAIVTFLNLVLQRPETYDLLLYSDENPEWLTDNPSFSNTWTELISKAIEKGNRIRIIHKVSNDINEMLHVIKQWLPLYVTGSVESYYYPNLRDGVYKRTLYVAPGLAAVSSNSIGNRMDGTANILMTESSIVDSFSDEFFNYLRLCKPLVKLVPIQDIGKTLAKTIAYHTDFILQSNTLSAITMPLAFHEALLHNMVPDPPSWLSEYTDHLASLRHKLETSTLTHFISLPDLQDVLDGNAEIPFSKALYGRTLFYTVEEFRQHLEHVISLMEDCPGLYIHPVTAGNDTDSVIYIAENHGVLIYNGHMGVALEINENNLLLALSHYVTNNKDVYTERSREDTITYLKNISNKLQMKGDEYYDDAGN